METFVFQLLMNQKLQTVMLTRRRIDMYMLPAFVLATLIGILRAILEEKSELIVIALPMLVFWFILRFSTKKSGEMARTLSSYMGRNLLLWWSLAAFVLTVVLLWIDVTYFGHPLHSPLEPYHFFLAIPPFVILFAGVYAAESFKQQHGKLKSDDREIDAG